MTTGPGVSRSGTRQDDPRRFNLGDLGIIIASSAVFFTAARLAYHRSTSLAWTFTTPYSSMSGGDAIPSWFEALGSGLVAATFALILIRLRHPRPRWRRLARHPGWVACLAAAIGVGVALALERIQSTVDQLLMIDPRGGDASARAESRFTLFPASAAWAGGLAVLVAWLILRLDGRWRAEPSWVDRAGRCVGVAWLLAPLANLGMHIRSMIVDFY